MNSSCTTSPGTTTTVSTANSFAYGDSGTAALVTVDGVTIRLNAAGTTGLLAQSGGAISFNGGNLTTVSVGAAASNQTGLRAVGAGSQINSSLAFITMVPASGNASNLTGVSAESGGTVLLTGPAIQIGGGANGVSDHALSANGGRIDVVASPVISTSARGSFGAVATNGGVINLSNGTQVSTTGAQNGTIGSHGLYAIGAGSQINGTTISVSTSGLLASAARAEQGGTVSLTSSTLNSGSNASVDTDPSSAARVLSGGRLDLNDVIVNATGQRGVGVSVQDAGSVALVSNSRITTAGNRAPGVFIFDGGAATVTGSTITSQNNLGISVTGAGSSLVMIGSNVTSTGAPAAGVRVLAGSTANILGGSVRTEGRDSQGIQVGSATVIATNVNVTTIGPDNSMGVLADIGSNVTLLGGSVTTTGSQARASTYPHGLVARNPGGTLTATGTTVLTTGVLGMGGVADDGGTLTLNDLSVTTRGLTSIGLYSTVEQAGSGFAASVTANRTTIETQGQGAAGAMAVQHFNIAPSVLTLNDSSVTTRGDASVGVRATTAATAIANRSTVLTQGAASYGIEARDNGSSVTLNQNTTVTTTGASAHGALANSGGLVTGNDSMVRASGVNASALYAAGAPGFVSTANFTRSVLTNSSGPTIGVAGNANISLVNSIAGGSGQWLRVGTLNDFSPLAAPDASLAPIEDPDPAIPLRATAPTPAALPIVPGLANITLTGSAVVGSALTATGSVSNVTMTNSAWDMTGSSNLTNLSNNTSVIAFSAPTAGFKTLTVQNYAGAGGLISLNTFLGTDGSPSDKLVINGGAGSGSTGLMIRNAGGPGAVTTGNGILVIDAQNGGTTTPGAFSLATPAVAGPYEYGLFRGSADASAPQSWFLRTNAAPRPETSLYAVMPALGLQYGGKLLDTLDERWGSWRRQNELDGRASTGRIQLASASDTPRVGEYPTGLEDAAWGRLVYQHGNRDGLANGVLDVGPSYQYDFYALQGGFDLYRDEDPEGRRTHAGIYAAIGQGKGSVTHFDGRNAGDDRFTAYTLGGYWTRIWNKDGYLDAILQATWYDATANSGRGLVRQLDTQGLGIAASLEAGYPFRFDKGWLLEPQGQLVYGRLKYDSASDDGGSVSFPSSDTLLGRLGGRLARNWRGDDGHLKTGWARLSVWHQFRGESTAAFQTQTGSIPFTSSLKGDWWEIKAGYTTQMRHDWTFYANLGYQRSFDGDRDAYDAKLGLRYEW